MKPLELRPHDHACLIYADPTEMLDVVAGTMHGAYLAGERHLHILRGPVAAFVEAMAERGIDVGERMRRGDLALRDASETYLPDGRFDPERMLGLLAESEADARAAGYRGARATGEMTWRGSGLPGIERADAYEAALNDVLPHLMLRGVCLYDAMALPEDALLSALRTHPRIIAEGVVLDNVVYGAP